MNTFELTHGERVSRAVIGAGLILYTMSVPASPLGLLALLPLIATYPIFTAMIGIDPVAGFIKLEFNKLIATVKNQHIGQSSQHS